MVEVPLRPANGPNPSTEQLGSICSKIKNAPFGKLVLRSRKTGDSVGDNDEQKPSGHSSGVHAVGQSAPTETNLVCGARDESHHPHQGDPREDVDHQALNLSIPRKHFGEEGSDGSMEVEGHSG